MVFHICPAVSMTPPRTSSLPGETPRKPASTRELGSSLSDTGWMIVLTVGSSMTCPPRSTVIAAAPSRFARIKSVSSFQLLMACPLKATTLSPTCIPACLAGVCGSPSWQVAGTRPAGMTQSLTTVTSRVDCQVPWKKLMPKKIRNARSTFMAGPPSMMMTFCHTGF